MNKNDQFAASIDAKIPADPTTGAVPLVQESAVELLNYILSLADDGTVVFDLDSTLLNNRPRSARIMREFGVKKKNKQLQQASESHWESWSTEQAMRNIGLDADEIQHLIDDFYTFWTPRFFSSAYCSEDIPVEGAVEFVSKVHAAGAKVIYLTGRDEGMRDGTVENLYSLKFPIPGQRDCKLMMKGDPSESDDIYKARSISGVADAGELLAAFDNEPTHINLYRSRFPEAISVHLLTDHSGRNVRLSPGVFSIRSFAGVTLV